MQLTSEGFKKYLKVIFHFAVMAQRMRRADLELGFFIITSLFITDLLLIYIVYTDVCRSEGQLAYLAAFKSNILGCVTKTC